MYKGNYIYDRYSHRLAILFMSIYSYTRM